MAVKERIYQYLESKGVTPTAAERALGWSVGALTKAKSITSDRAEEFLLYYSDLSAEWLIRGEGDMIRDSNNVTITTDKTPGAIPYYKELPVSAGKLDVIKKFVDSQDEHGWIKLPNASAIAAFPVVGCSMEPHIEQGDIIAIAPIERWDKVDPDKVYMIITKYERMIKHLMVDENSDKFIWAVSPNYNKFKVPVDEIIEIYKVVFHGRLM